MQRRQMPDTDAIRTQPNSAYNHRIHSFLFFYKYTEKLILIKIKIILVINQLNVLIIIIIITHIRN